MPSIPFLPKRPTYSPDDLVKVPDDLPPSLAPPLVVDRIESSWDPVEGRAEFRVVIRDAAGQRCPNVAVEATIEGPERTATGEVATSLMGAAQFRMAGPAGEYRCTVIDVGAKGIAWDPGASTTTAQVTATEA